MNQKIYSENVCTSQECVSAASDILSSWDLSVDPCDDFYDFVCRKWFNNTVIMDDNTDKFVSISKDMNRKLKEILEEEKPAQEPKHFQKAQTFYKSCMNWKSRQMEGVEAFLQDLTFFGGFPVLKGEDWDPTSFDFLNVSKNMLARGLEPGFIFQIGMDVDFKNNSFERIVITQPTVGLTKQEYFEIEGITALYTNFLIMQARELCLRDDLCTNFNLTHVTSDIEEAVEIETRIAKMMLPTTFIQKKENAYNVMNISSLQELAPKIQWLPFVQLFFPNATEEEEIIVTAPFVLQEISVLFDELISTPQGKRKLANYLMYRQMKEVSLHLNAPVRYNYYELLAGMTGDLEITTLWEECLSLTTTIFDFSIATIYIQKHFPPQRKTAMEALMEDIRGELREILLDTPWMDDVTRKEALLKLEKIYSIAAYPEDLLDEDKVNDWYSQLVVGEDHYENFKQGNIFLIMKASEGHGRITDRSSWKHLPAPLLEANALYNPTNNSILVPLGIAQTWFFHENNPKFVNFGRIGFVIAHEFGHAFDSEGADLDEVGNWRNWWRNDTLQHFKQSSKCMVDIFDGYFVEQANMTINGTLTLTENIADDIGVAEVYRAYVRRTKHCPEKALPGINLNSRQLFWVNVASVWCEKQTMDHYEEIIKKDEHSPAKYRVISPLSNNQDFIRDFGCKLGSGMNKNPDKCHVWGV